jgi:NADH:ubiquinone oxidoreductase subunit 4 (subunit M)
MWVVSTLNGIAILRAYLLIFTGQNRSPSPLLRTTPRERVAILGLLAVMLLFGLAPQWILSAMHESPVHP